MDETANPAQGKERIALQDIFDKAWQKFIVEDNPPALNEWGQCVYRNASGHRCAVGWSLPDGEWLDDKGSFSELVVNYPHLFDENMFEIDHEDLDTFQRLLHDSLKTFSFCWPDKQVMIDSYKEAAAEFDLDIPPYPEQGKEGGE